jgi:hypothetical protein
LNAWVADIEQATLENTTFRPPNTVHRTKSDAMAAEHA